MSTGHPRGYSTKKKTAVDYATTVRLAGHPRGYSTKNKTAVDYEQNGISEHHVSSHLYVWMNVNVLRSVEKPRG